MLFKASASDVRINTLWFLSLIIALVDALFGLLCKQWLREHRRPIHTRTPAEALALRCLRQESLEKWHVQSILASLPMLLELALFLFLAGVLELLWAYHPVPFAFASAVVCGAGLFYLGTTIAPSVDIIRQALQVTPELRAARLGKRVYSAIEFVSNLPPTELVCPYKSPQAWAAFKAFRTISSLPGFVRASYYLCGLEWNIHPYRNEKDTFDKTMDDLITWSSVDLEIIQRSNINLDPSFYELNAFHWLVAEFRDAPFMLPHLQNILETIPMHLVVPVVMGRWFLPVDREWTTQDIATILRQKSFAFCKENFMTFEQLIFLQSVRHTELFHQLIHYIHVLLQPSEPDALNNKRLSDDLFSKRIKPPILGFPVSFHQMDTLLKDPRTRDVGSGLWGILERLSRSPSTKIGYWAMLMHLLAEYIISSALDYTFSTPTVISSSHFFSTDAGLKFFIQMNQVIIDRNVFEDNDRSKELWIEATDIVQRVHSLSKDGFMPLPGYFPLPLSRLEGSLKIPSSGLGNPDNDYGYLDTFREHWDNVEPSQKEGLIGILSKHVNSYRFHSVDPVILSSAGLRLITFMNRQLVEEQLGNVELIGWLRALEHIKFVRGLPVGYFESSYAPLDDTGGISDHGNEDIPSISAPSPDLEGGGQSFTGDEDVIVEQGGIPMEILVLRHPAGDIEHHTYDKEIQAGNPDADNNV